MGGGVAGARLADVVVHAEVVVGQEKGDVTAQLPQMEAQNVPARHPNRRNVTQDHAAVCIYSLQYTQNMILNINQCLHKNNI